MANDYDKIKLMKILIQFIILCIISLVMKMNEIEEILDKLITEDEYDSRLIPYIKEFFRYNAEQFGWDKETITRKISLLKQRGFGIEFVDLEEGEASIDFVFKNILVNSSVKGEKLTQEELLQLTSEIFTALETVTKDGRESDLQYVQEDPLYWIETLKYSRDESIIQFISNAFNIDRRDVHRIKDIFKEMLKEDNKDQESFLNDSILVFLPEVARSAKRIMEGKEETDKAHEYITLYGISLQAIRYRLQCGRR